MFHNILPISFSQRLAPTRPFQYKLTVDAVNKPITLAELKLQLAITDTTHDAILDSIIDAVTLYAERFTGREFINKTFETFIDLFPPSVGNEREDIRIKRSRVNTINSIKFLDKDAVEQTVDTSVFFLMFSNDFTSIVLNDDQDWPTDVLEREQAITIEFVAGYGADDTDVPADLKQALLAHAAFLFENRGDCADACSGSSVPLQAQIVYNLYKILDIGGA